MLAAALFLFVAWLLSVILKRGPSLPARRAAPEWVDRALVAAWFDLLDGSDSSSVQEVVLMKEDGLASEEEIESTEAAKMLMERTARSHEALLEVFPGLSEVLKALPDVATRAATMIHYRNRLRPRSQWSAVPSHADWTKITRNLAHVMELPSEPVQPDNTDLALPMVHHAFENVLATM